MASLFQEFLEKIRQRSGKYEDIKEEIIKDILQVYKRSELFINTLE
ncbi:MAG: hypothetical protein F6K25_28145 [Okeania sp. SIO2G4]|nr:MULTISPECIES: hypothetical protein [unclassified Okeania]NEP03821.1 hypothetical protein [Okeania sp. SIO4D6]NEP40414.1 hypothetical protein [Okeania sp. SIO2H7]NEP75443.1 hypothetical protein [Okeania sp. SIO2G5]NEP96541.1 hypothetical protein [Okeania sp. SIO2F5]NEQ94312.1 hypothetical protein [Okeania sp. SIO2G4]